MKKIQFYIALYVAKASQFMLKILGRNATYLPGKIAERLCKHFLKYVEPPKTVIAVTGTNGKTTVSNLLASILTENGYRVTNNSFGSNVQAGVITALIGDTKLNGKPKNDIAVLEVDERSSLLIYPYLKPDYLVCNNIMRDSLKRNAHTEFISYIINKAIPSTTKLVLNGDDLIASLLGRDNEHKVYFGISAEKPEESLPQHIQDIIYCPDCGNRLSSEYIRYNHIGRLYCSQCGLKSPELQYAVTEIDRTNNAFTVTNNEASKSFTLINDNIVNVYNFCAVIAVLSEIGLTHEQIGKGFSQSKIVKTRFDSVSVGDYNITLLMAKGQNPIACARCYNYAAQHPSTDKAVLILVDDKNDNTGNSENACWLYDSDYSSLADDSINQIVFAGPRCKDHYLRGLMAGIPAEKMKTISDSASAAKVFDPKRSKNIFILHDLYRPDDAAAIKRELISIAETEVV